MKQKKQKFAKNLGKAMGVMADVGIKTAKGAHKAAKGAQQVAVGLAEKALEEKEKSKMRKLNPVFLDDFLAPDYNTPNIIQIVDDVVRKDVKGVEGSMGWRNFVKGVEVFNLYDEQVKDSNLQFVPAPMCDAIYYVDPHNRNKFININIFFERMRESKLAELQHVAFSLGAKRYSVEIVETKKSSQSMKRKATAEVKKDKNISASASEEGEFSLYKRSSDELAAHAVFHGKRTPTPPTLVWFAHDDNIRNLVNMCCNAPEESSVKEFTISIKGNESVSMGMKEAANVSAVVGKLGGSKAAASIQKKHEDERSHTMIFKVEF